MRWYSPDTTSSQASSRRSDFCCSEIFLKAQLRSRIFGMAVWPPTLGLRIMGSSSTSRHGANPCDCHVVLNSSFNDHNAAFRPELRVSRFGSDNHGRTCGSADLFSHWQLSAHYHDLLPHRPRSHASRPQHNLSNLHTAHHCYWCSSHFCYNVLLRIWQPLLRYCYPICITDG